MAVEVAPGSSLIQTASAYKARDGDVDAPSVCKLLRTTTGMATAERAQHRDVGADSVNQQQVV